MRTKPEQHSWSSRAVLLIGCLSGLLSASLLAQPGGDTGGGTGGTNGVPEAPIDGLYYARLNAAWKDFAPGLYSMQSDAPQDGGYYARSDNLWKQIQSTVTGGTLDVLIAAASEFQPDGIDGTLVAANTAAYINLNHLYDPDGLITELDQVNHTIRVQTGRYAVTVVIPVCLQGSGPGNNRVPYTIGLWDVQAGTNIYYSSYTLYDEDRSQITSVFMPIVDALGDKDYAIRIVNLDTEQALVCGLDNEIAGLANHYTEVSIMKLSGAVSLPATQWAVENLLINTALEAGTVGQAIGYTAAGEVGVVSLGSGGGGRADVVIGQDSVADMTNNVMPDLNGLERVIVSNTNSTSAELYQAAPLESTVTVPMPAGFAALWKGPAVVLSRTGTNYDCDLRAAQFRRTTSINKHRYANAITGNDTYDGTAPVWSSGTVGPVKTWTRLNAVIGSQTGFELELHLAAGNYSATTNSFGYNIWTQLTCDDPEGARVTVYGVWGTNFVAYSGSAYVTWTNIVSSDCFDFSIRDATTGAPQKLTAATGLDDAAKIAAVVSTPGTFHSSTDGKTYVHLSDNRVPDDYCITSRAVGMSSTFSPNNGCYATNVTFISSDNPGFRVFTSAYTNSFYLDDIEMVGGTGDGSLVVQLDAGFVFLDSCAAYHGANDGFNYKQRTTWSSFSVLERNCVGGLNGTDDSDNASTVHDGIPVIRVGGRYYDGARTVHDVGSGGSWNLGCSSQNGRESVWKIGTTSQGSEMWLDGCSASGTPSLDLYALGAGDALRYTRMTIDAADVNNTGGTFEEYTEPALRGLPSLTPELVWNKIGDIYPDAPTDGQTYGRKDNAWVVVTGGAAKTTRDVYVDSVIYLFEPDADVLRLTGALQDPITLTGAPTIAPGTPDQQLVITNASTFNYVFKRHNFDGYTATQIECPELQFVVSPGYYVVLRWNATTSRWDAYGRWPVIRTQAEVNLLPAPWDPPDEDGNQVIRDDVQDALIDALLPRLLQRIGPSAGTMPAPAPAPRPLGAPGTRGNPINWPAAAAADDTGKYSININIRDQ